MPNKFKQRFAELEAQLKEVQATERTEHSPYTGSSRQVDRTLKLGWEVKAKHLLQAACGLESQHFKHFEEAAEGSMYVTSSEVLTRMGTVFLLRKKISRAGIFHQFVPWSRPRSSTRN